MIAWISTASAQERPDLIGSWTGQDGELFTGYIRWAMDGGEEAAADDREPFIGVIGHDGEEITIAEVDDNGVWRGKLLDGDRLALSYVEADLEGDFPESVVISGVFRRQR